MRRSSVLITTGALVCALAPVPSVANAAQPNADTTYTADFESSATVHVGDEITNQYPFVTFDAFHATGYGFSFGPPANGTIAVPTGNPIVIASDAHGGSNAGQVACGSEFCSAGTFGVLNNTADSISVYVGDSASSSVPVELDAYDAGKQFLGSATATTSGTGASTHLSYTAPTGKSIAYFTAYRAGSGVGTYLDIDDLTISVPSGAGGTVGVSAGAASYEIGQGGTIAIPLTIQRINGATGAVSLAVQGLTSTLTGSATNPGTGNTATLSVTAAQNASLASVPISISAASGGATSQAPVTVTIIIVAPITFAAPKSVDNRMCESNTLTVEAQIAPGEPGSQVAFSTTFSPAATGLTAKATTPATISNGLADSTVTLSSTSAAAATNLVVTAALSNGVSASVSIKVARFGPTITAVDAIDSHDGHPVGGDKASTPRAENPGTTIEVYGLGFCDTAIVAVGNAKATATATVKHLSNNSGSYDYVRILTPRLATSGPVTVTAGSPGLTSNGSSQTLIVDSYRNSDAWSFQNFDPDLELGDLTQAFGADQTYLHVDVCGFLTLGLGHCSVELVPDPIAVVLLGIAQANMETGTCFGFALSSQRILEGRASLSSLPGNPATIFDAPKPDTSSQGAHGTQPVLDLLKSVHLMQLSVQFVKQWLGSVAALNVLPGDQVSDDLAGQITHILSEGRYPLVEMQDGGGHVVVAYDLDKTGPSTYDIYVYDSNDPFASNEVASDGGTHATNVTNSVIHLAADGSWSLASTTQTDHAPWHGGIGDLVVTDPAIIPEHPTLPSLGGGAPPGALFSSLGGPGTSRGGLPSSARITQVSSGGHTLYTPSGSLNNSSTRLDAAPFGPFVDDTTQAKNLPQTIAVGGSIHDLKVATDGKSAGSATLTFVQGPYSGEVQGSTASGTSQTDSFSSGAGSVGFAGTSTAPVTLDVARSTSTSEHSVEVSLAHSGSADALTLGAGNGAVVLSHSGGATTFTLTMSGTQSDGLPNTVVSRPIAIGAGQTARVTGIHWGKQGHATLRIGGHSVKLRSHSLGPHAATISRLHVTSAGKHKVGLSVKAKLPSLSKSSQAFVVWLVHRGHHLLASHRVTVRATKRTANAKWTTRLSKGERLTFTAVVVTIAISGATESSAHSSRSTTFHVR